MEHYFRCWTEPQTKELLTTNLFAQSHVLYFREQAELKNPKKHCDASIWNIIYVLYCMKMQT